MYTTRIYACRGHACSWRGTIDDMPVVECPVCGGGHLEYIGDTNVTENPNPRTLFNSPRTRDREAEVDQKTEKKRPGFFEKVGDKLRFRRSER